MNTDPVERVFVMFKAHLDVGYTHPEQEVLRLYFEEHIPRAITIAETLRERGDGQCLVWTVPAWLLYEYLEQAAAPERARADRAIGHGDLAWHALPFTWYTELLDRSSVTASLGFSKRLDARYGRRTSAARLTDVPGHTRGLIGPLAEAGVTFLDIGCNPGCRAPAVPYYGEAGQLPESNDDEPDPDAVFLDETGLEHRADAAARRRLATEGLNDPRTHLFDWRDPEGAEIAVLYHPHAYGSTVRLPGTTDVVSMRVHHDNDGPHSIASVEAAYASLRRKFPGAEIVACDLSRIAELVQPLRPRLPVVTAEIGDTWIYGTGSDPAKTSTLRELLRARREWLDSGKLRSGDDVDIALLGQLIPAPEHNWGLCIPLYLPRNDTYRVDELAAARACDPSFAAVDAECAYKRDRPRIAASMLPEPLRADATRRLDALREPAPELRHPIDTSPRFDNGRLQLEISPRDGSIAHLVDLETGREWAGIPGLARFTYQVFSADDFRRFNERYNTEAFAFNELSKPGLAAYPAASASFSPSTVRQSFTLDSDGCTVVVDLTPPSIPEPQLALTAWPRLVRMRYHLPTEADTVELTVWICGKQANRRPEAMWLSFAAAEAGQDGWRLDKLDQPVDPHDVISGGGRHLHGVGCGFSYQDATGTLRIDTLDAHLVSPGTRALLQFDDEPLDLSQGMHVNLYNNLWGTAFPQWYDQDMRFRFAIACEPPAADGAPEQPGSPGATGVTDQLHSHDTNAEIL